MGSHERSTFAYLSSALAHFMEKISQETLLYEWNARNQITLWGPKGEILDYAVKQWSGVVRDYLLPRWGVFVDELLGALYQDRDFNNTSFRKRVFNEVEKPFTFSTKIYEPYPTGLIT